eukprot:gnl/Dysnectes_brevis/4966_a6931_458.p1 GENE.gnl/Dysnectes_brevis/4966_a6931_458~~gnl/Dysnectes_brevis/4966_a6931_458.p1  ORF type:complete len:514 (-),score=68.37 gnl/Dysnectes_brevis/4966_a6931_458:43-1584(-)
METHFEEQAPSHGYTRLRESLAIHLSVSDFNSAQIIAEKLFSLTNSLADLHTYVNILFSSQQPGLCILVLSGRPEVETDLKTRLLLAKSYRLISHYQNAAQILGDKPSQMEKAASGILRAAICLERAIISRKRMEPEQALFWAVRALVHNPSSAGAVQLLEGLSPQERIQVSGAIIPRAPPLLAPFYSSVLRNQEHSSQHPAQSGWELSAAVTAAWAVGDEDTVMAAGARLSAHPELLAHTPAYSAALFALGHKPQLHALASTLQRCVPGASAWLASGLFHLASGEMDKAAVHIDRACSEEPCHMHAVMAQGEAYSMQESPAKATTSFRRAVRLSPGDPRPLIRLGRETARQCKMQAALSELRLALPDPSARLELAGVLLRDKEQKRPSEEALEVLGSLEDSVGEATGSVRRARACSYHGLRGHALRRLCRWKDAMASYESSLALDGGSSCRYGVGMCMEAMGMRAGAIQQYVRALSSCPDSESGKMLLSHALGGADMCEVDQLVGSQVLHPV